MRSILVSEAYSASNIGDAELVSRTLEYAKGLGSPVRCLAVDPESFARVLDADVHIDERLFPRLRLLKAEGSARAGIAARWIAQAALMTFLAAMPVSIARALTRRAVDMHLVPHSAVYYLQAKRVVAVGGGYLGDQYVKESLMTLWTWWWSGRIGAAVETMPISVEIRAPYLRLAVRFFARHVTWRVRDSSSAQCLLRCSVKADTVPDLAFANYRRPKSKRTSIVLALVGSDYIDLSQVDRLVNGLASAIALLGDQRPVVLVTMHSSLSGTSVGGDRVAAERLKSALSAQGLLNVEIASVSSFDEVCGLCESADLVISARMHAGIAALCSGARVGLLAYEEKHYTLMRDLGLSDFVIPVTAAQSEIVDLVDRLLKTDERPFTTAASEYRDRLASSGVWNQ
ncbi:polysaccharide pyruvyl transferase family protein [Gordonia terrae]|uniref:polysaccharide pyruvyl transferase family protein n=1 Tax=Gordonia terrae TaxID=2055 RepID=UPI001EE65C16|nr:polysaccharide pyruvyl transferase family protein [Gordonia terrae]